MGSKKGQFRGILLPVDVPVQQAQARGACHWAVPGVPPRWFTTERLPLGAVPALDLDVGVGCEVNVAPIPTGAEVGYLPDRIRHPREHSSQTFIQRGSGLHQRRCLVRIVHVLAPPLGSGVKSFPGRPNLWAQPRSRVEGES